MAQRVNAPDPTEATGSATETAPAVVFSDVPVLKDDGEPETDDKGEIRFHVAGTPVLDDGGEPAVDDEGNPVLYEAAKKKGRKRPTFVVPESGFENIEQILGQLIVGEGEEPRETNPLHFVPLKKASFAKEGTYLRWRAHMTDIRAEKLAGSAVRLRKQADILDKFGDSDLAKKAKRLARMRDQLAALESEISDAGIDLDAL